jgi:hypothetical protein
MTMPDRPDPGEATLASWGQPVHDAVFTPLGTRVAGGAAPAVGLTLTKLPLNVALDDPGGWLNTALDHVTVPVDGAGLYDFSLDVTTDNGDDSSRTYVNVHVNGVNRIAFYIDQEGTTSHTDGRGGFIPLDDGDVIEVWARVLHGAHPNVSVVQLALVRRAIAIGT